jgi:tetratricopeptide (TPR) repeat protein
MLRLIKKIWHLVRDWVSHWLTPQPSGSNRPLLSSLNATEPGQTLSDTDFEFIFSQLLDGVAHGWHEGRIVKFFDQLGDLGRSRYWVPWLERFSEKVLASPTPNLQLADRLLRLGSMAQSFSQTAHLGEVAYDLGRKLYARESGPAIWEYQGPGAITDATASGAAWVNLSEFVDQGADQTTDQTGLAQPDGEMTQLTLEELFALLEQDENLRKTLADQLELVHDNPQDIISHLVHQAESAQTEDSTEQLPQTQALDPQALDPQAPETPTLVDQWFDLGLQQVQAGQLEQAIASWDNALALEPNLAEAWQNRATVLGMVGRLEEALNNIEKAIALEPEEASYWFSKAGIYCGLTLWEEAISTWDHVITLRSDDHQAWHNRGFTLEQQGKIPDAIESYQRALLIQPDFESAQDRLQALLSATDAKSGTIV